MSDSIAQQPKPRPEGDTPCYERTLDSDDPVTDFVMAVASIADEDPGEMPQLQRTIDTGIIERLLEQDGSDANARLSFSYHGYRVTMWSDGDVSFQPVSD